MSSVLESSTASWVKPYLIGLLEFSLEQSPYNYDIQLALLRLYDSFGSSVSFSFGLANLTLKGVQLESLGHLYLRHSLDFANTDLFEQKLAPKYQKYLKLNLKDLKSLKHKALKENNYSQLENFVDYESFTDKSYLKKLVDLYSLLTDLTKTILSSSSPVKESVDEFLGGLGGEMGKKLEGFRREGTTRTQDVRVQLVY